MPSEVNNDFVYNYLPKVILTEALYRNKKNKFQAMNKYLKSIGIEYSVVEILQCAVKHLVCKKIVGGKVCFIDIDSNIKLGDHTLLQICNLIDFGNTEVKGTRAIQSAMDYVNENRNLLIERYLREH